jgi:hypothetical protein
VRFAWVFGTAQMLKKSPLTESQNKRTVKAELAQMCHIFWVKCKRSGVHITLIIALLQKDVF